MSIGKSFTQIESVFNFAECLPVVPLVSGPLRAVIGKMQAIAGVILFTGGVVLQLMTESDEWNKLRNFGLEMIAHGLSNVVRGIAETIFCAITLGVGNSALFLINMPRNYQPFFRYSGEEEGRSFSHGYPLGDTSYL